MKKLTSLVLATGMVLSLAACGGSGSSTAASTNTDGSTATTDTAAADESNLGYEYGEHFHSDEPVTYTMFFNDNPAYPMNDKWINEGVFKAIEEATNVHLELTVVDNSNYTDKVSLAVSSGTSPYIIPKIYKLRMSPAAALSPSPTMSSICPTTPTSSRSTTCRTTWPPSRRLTASTTACPA